MKSKNMINCFLGRHYPISGKESVQCLYCRKILSEEKMLRKHMIFTEELKEFNGKKVLDIGCGEFPLGTINADIDPRNPKANIVLNDSGRLPFENESFDAITLSDVLQQAKNPVVLLKESKRVLRKNGSIFASVPNSGNILFRLGLWKQETVIGIKHKHFWSKKEFELFASKAGLKTKKFIPSYYSLGNSFIFKLFPSLCFCLFFELKK